MLGLSPAALYALAGVGLLLMVTGAAFAVARLTGREAERGLEERDRSGRTRRMPRP